MQYQHRGQWQSIGELVVSASYQGAYQRALDRLLFLVLANGAKTFLVAVFTLFIFYRLIGRHLDHIARYAHAHSNAENASPLVLQRKAPLAADELSELVDSTNHLRDELIRLSHEQRERADTLAQQADLLALQLCARQQTEAALHLMATVFESSREAILITDARNRIAATNEAFCRLTGYSHEEVLGQDPKILSAGRTERELYRQMWADLSSKGTWQGEIWDRRKDGVIYPKWISITVVRNERQEVVNHIAIFSDLSERMHAQERIYHLAHYDSLTDLPNRLRLSQALKQAIDLAQRNRGALALMVIDLDRFKAINDVFGHGVGDEVLVQVAQRLLSSVRTSDLVARLNGDEFAVLLPEVAGVDAVASLADKVLHCLSEPYQVQEHALRCTPSIGLALCPSDGGDSETLMKMADSAMYHAKSQGRSNVQFFTTELDQGVMDRLRLESDLRAAIEAGQFELHYQPQVEGDSGRIVGVEALVRWRHPREGLVLPTRFIPVAEESGLILPLGEWVFDEACRQVRAWRDEGISGLIMSVNLSAHQLRSPKLQAFIEWTLHRHGLEGAELELEITETAVMADPETCVDRLKALRKLGIRLSIDDFGTGYSSLSYLKRLPIQTLKLDRSFVRDIETDPSDVTICISTIALAHDLGLSVIAEGVETGAQRDFLTRHRCDVLQGYLFSKPVPAREALVFIRGHSLA